MINIKEVTVFCFVGIPPGGGKSTLCREMNNKYLEHGFDSIIECSDDFRYSDCPKSDFERSFRSSLREGHDIVFYDKNIPDEKGYSALKRLVSGIDSLEPDFTEIPIKLIPVTLPKLVKNDVDKCIERVMQREPNSQALTSAATFCNFDSVGEFIVGTFAIRCSKYIKHAHKLENVIVLTNHSFDSPEPGIIQMAEILNL
jgi:hypothetical protein